MAINKWECDVPQCPSVAVGVGSAAGLLAIGWFFRAGGSLLCPHHYPYKMPCREDPRQMCEGCAADAQAQRVQQDIKFLVKAAMVLNDMGPSTTP